MPVPPHLLLDTLSLHRISRGSSIGRRDGQRPRHTRTRRFPAKHSSPGRDQSPHTSEDKGVKLGRFRRRWRECSIAFSSFADHLILRGNPPSPIRPLTGWSIEPEKRRAGLGISVGGG